MVALALLATAAVVAVKLADLAASAIVMEAGTVSRELLLARTMTAPPAAAACDRVTVQVVGAFAATIVEVQASEEINAEGARLRAVLAELPL